MKKFFLLILFCLSVGFLEGKGVTLADHEKLVEWLTEKSAKKEIYGLVGMVHAQSPYAQVAEEYFKSGGTLYSLYPQGGMELLSSEEQALYVEKCERYPHRFFEIVLNCQSINPEYIGATYFYRDLDGTQYVCLLTQETLLSGKVHSTLIWPRITNLFDYLISIDGPTFARFGIGRLVSK